MGLKGGLGFRIQGMDPLVSGKLNARSTSCPGGRTNVK